MTADTMNNAIERLRPNFNDRMDYDESCSWIIIKNLPLNLYWNKDATDLLLLYDESIEDIGVYVDSDLAYTGEACMYIFEYSLADSGWKRLCTWIYRDMRHESDIVNIMTEVLALLYMPSFCRIKCIDILK